MRKTLRSGAVVWLELLQAASLTPCMPSIQIQVSFPLLHRCDTHAAILTGYLKHVWNVLGRAGYSRVDMNTTSAWDVLWAHDYPFKKIRDKMLAIKPGQKVNKFPGSGYITNKV